ncbi:tetratricopeptide repeat protein [Candidatus Uhrbacteria bacterium]|nr:tetratricopeptide repeat protein [Candidatus Uhrbacteria bacterium]
MLLDYLSTKYHSMLEQGWGAFEMGNLEKAERHFKDVLEHEDDPHISMYDLAEAHNGMGAVNFAHKDFFDAHRWYKESQYLLDHHYDKHYPVHMHWHNLRDRPAMRMLMGLGHLAYQRGDTSRALHYYKTLLHADSSDELGVKKFICAIESDADFEEVFS